MLRQQRIQAKLQSLVLASVRVTDGELMQRFADGTVSYDALYALFRSHRLLVKDADVQLTDDDLRAFYQENIDQYKFEASRKLKYVLFLENASSLSGHLRPGARTWKTCLEGEKAALDFLELVYTYSDRPDSGVVFHRGELSACA
jgi:hypothetical protein